MEKVESIEIAQVLEEIKAAVAERRKMAAYPPELESELAEHFERVQKFRVTHDTPRPRLPEEISAPLVSVGWFARSRIPVESSFPGGKAFQRAVGGATARWVQGALHMVEEYTDVMYGVVNELASNDVSASNAIDALQVRVDAMHERLEQVARQLGLHSRSLSAVPPEPEWFDPIALERFRGNRDDLMWRYEGLADRFIGKAPVLDFGCGRGDFLHLLTARDIICSGVELDARIAQSGRDEGLAIAIGDGFDALANFGEGELGGLVSLQVIEHLEREVLLHFIDEARRVLRPGGVLVFETPNPRSLFVHASSFWLDATHVRLVDPEYLALVLEMAGFHDIEIEYRSELPEPTRLERHPTDNLITRNVLRLNELVYAACDYAVIAKR